MHWLRPWSLWALKPCGSSCCVLGWCCSTLRIFSAAAPLSNISSNPQQAFIPPKIIIIPSPPVRLPQPVCWLLSNMTDGLSLAEKRGNLRNGMLNSSQYIVIFHSVSSVKHWSSYCDAAVALQLYRASWFACTKKSPGRERVQEASMATIWSL